MTTVSGRQSTEQNTTRRSNSLARRVRVSSKRSRPVLLIDIIMIVTFAVTQPVFLQWSNVQNLLIGVAVLSVIAFGETFVLLTGAADLSVAATATLVGYMFGHLLQAGVPSGLGLVLAVIFGALLGVVNGLLVGVLRLSFFVVTLASMTAYTGVVNLWSNTQSITVSSSLMTNLAIKSHLGIPGPIWIMAIVLLICVYIQNFTMFGRDIYAVGGNVTAARLSGVRAERVLIGVYALVGMTAAIGGLLTVGQLQTASPLVDPNLPLNAIAAVLLGGASLAGGAGGVGGTLLGVVFLGVLQNGLGLAGIQSFWQQVLTGVILVLAVLGDKLSSGALAQVVPRPLRALFRRDPKQ